MAVLDARLATGESEEHEASAPVSNERLTYRVDGSESDDRRLTVDFDGFTGRLEAMPGLDCERLDRLHGDDEAGGENRSRTEIKEIPVSFPG
ncbi:hypothetical protein BH24ACT16_BH24ACT16_17820 [soil metagenome]